MSNQNAEKRSVSTDALETLGMIIGPNEKRDAIHLAVDPQVAVVKLYPGQDVGLIEGGAGPCDKPVGIVDPFLTAPVQPGERFWLVVYPRKITSLRHVWSHPAFAEAIEPVAVERPSKAASETWLREFIKRSDCPSYETVIAKAINNDSWSAEYLHFDGEDAHGEIPPEFYQHLEIVTGIKVPESDRATHFSCSC